MKKRNFNLLDLMVIIGIISIFSAVGFKVYENHNPKTFENYSLTCNGVKINKKVKSKTLFAQLQNLQQQMVQNICVQTIL